MNLITRLERKVRLLERDLAIAREQLARRQGLVRCSGCGSVIKAFSREDFQTKGEHWCVRCIQKFLPKQR